MAERLDDLADKDLDQYKVVIVTVGYNPRFSYIFSRQGIAFSYAAGMAECEVKIIKCRKGESLEISLSADGKLGVFKSEGVVTSIGAQK